MGWRIFKHTDANAPAITFSQRGSLAALLRACLVDGYGTTAPVGGWSEPFAEINNVAVFRADAGARQFYQIDDNSNTYPNVAYMSAFEAMSDVNTGTGQWCTNRYFGKHYQDAYFGWVVLANEYSVHLLLPSRYGWIPHFFGEYDSFWSNNPYNSCVMGHVVGSNYMYNGTTAYSALNLTRNSVRGTTFSASYPVDHHRLPDGTGLALGVATINNYDRISPGETTNYLFDSTAFPNVKPVFSPLYLGVYAGSINTTDPLYQKDLLLGRVPLVLSAYQHHFDISTADLLLQEYTDADSGDLLLHAPISYYNDLARRAFITYNITGIV